MRKGIPLWLAPNRRLAKQHGFGGLFLRLFGGNDSWNIIECQADLTRAKDEAVLVSRFTKSFVHNQEFVSEVPSYILAIQ